MDQLNRLDVRPRVFKVIPQHLETSPELIRFLQREQDQGSEIVLHGYAHRRSGAWQRPRRRQLRARLFAPNDAEFLSLTPVEIESRVGAGRAILQGAGLVVNGFCAPGWIESRDVRPVLRRFGFRYDVAMTHLFDLHSGRRIWTDWVGDMGAGPLQENLIGIANLINRGALALFSNAKLFLHPVAVQDRPQVRRMLSWLAALMTGRTLTTYQELVAGYDP